MSGLYGSGRKSDFMKKLSTKGIPYKRPGVPEETQEERRARHEAEREEHEQADRELRQLAKEDSPRGKWARRQLQRIRDHSNRFGGSG
jgi:hypothetical protein